MATARVVSSDQSLEVSDQQRSLSQTTSGRLRVDVTGSTTATPATLAAGTDRSGQITTGGAAQQLAPANASRQALKGQNISAADLWINETTGTAASAAIDTAGSYKVASGALFSVQTNKLVSVIGASTGQKWTATET